MPMMIFCHIVRSSFTLAYSHSYPMPFVSVLCLTIVTAAQVAVAVWNAETRATSFSLCPRFFHGSTLALAQAGLTYVNLLRARRSSWRVVTKGAKIKIKIKKNRQTTTVLPFYAGEPT